MAVLIKNNAVSRLASTISTGANTLSVQSGEGSRFPSPVGGEWFPVTVLKSDGTLEIMKCTERNGDVLSVSRAQEGTTAQAFVVGDRVELRLTAAAIAEFLQVSGVSAFMQGMLNDADAAEARTTLGLGTASTVDVGTGTGKVMVNGAKGEMISAELRFDGGTPFLDFANDATTDFDARIILTGDDTLDVQGVGYDGLKVSGQTVWNGGNFNPDSKQNNLGFTPVQQGGGAGQSDNKIYLGWGGSSVKIQVDSTNMGDIYADNNGLLKVVANIVGLGVGAIGSYGFLRNNTSIVLAPGSGISGSDAYWASHNAVNNQSPPGTWRVLGYMPSLGHTLCLRIA